jgi:signal transduction histidine kinase
MSEDFVRYAQADLATLQPSTVTLADLLEHASSDLRPQAADAGVALRLLPHDPAASAVLDLELVSRAIANLVSNAVRHSPRGSAVLLSTASDDGWLTVQVSDQGSGLSPQQLAQLASGDEGLRSAHRDGVGLGLRFAQRVARRHGGRLGARPQATGSGAVFELVLAAPVHAATPDAAGTSGNP